jgi:hypothetical protein
MVTRATKKRPVGGAAKKARGRAAKKPAARTASRKAAAYTVFVSHSSKDNWIAGQIAKEVRALGGEAWVDLNKLRGGDAFEEDILTAIRDCTEAVVLISSNSVNSQWVSYEIGAVAVQGKRVTPVLNNVLPEAMAPLRGVTAIDLNDFDKFLRELAGRIGRPGRGRRR